MVPVVERERARAWPQLWRRSGWSSTTATVKALDGLDLAVEEGTVLGLLGPNGAGKTTTVRILTTLLKPDAGRATVAGSTWSPSAEELRHVIGLSGQYAAVDEILTGPGEPRHGRAALPPGRRAVPGPGRRAAGAVRAHRRGQPAGQDLLRRHAPASRPGRQPRGAAADPVPRRAHDRSRPAQPARHVGRHRGAGEGRRHVAAHDPVPRGGRPAGRQASSSSTTAPSSPRAPPTS